MRWFAAIIAVVGVAVAAWLGSAVYTVGRIAASAQAGDGPAVLARTDLPALRRSLTEQIVRAYLERAGETRKISPVERMIANTYGATVADAMVAKFVTADTLTKLLGSGRFDGADNMPAFAGLPTLGDVTADDIAGLLGRIGFVQPTLLSIRVSPTANPDVAAAILLHLDVAGWRLAGLDLPKTVLRQLAASLPAR